MSRAFGHQHQRCLQPQCSLLAIVVFSFLGVAARLDMFLIPVSKNFHPPLPSNPHFDVSNFTIPAKFDAKMATPETFSETGSETMYEKV